MDCQFRSTLNVVFFALCVPLVFLVPPCSAAFAESNTQAESIGVIYPQVREPYLSVFKSILGGIGEELGRNPASKALRNTTKASDVEKWINNENIESLICLGNAGLKASRLISAADSELIGAVMLSDQQLVSGFNAISMTPAPTQLFIKLKELVPTVNRIKVIYDPDSQSWLINKAKMAAKNKGLELHAEPVANVREAAVSYKAILANQDPEKDAIWLLQGGPALKERTVLYMILQTAWDNNLVVFSSNPSHVTKGALFSLYPDNTSVGRTLARSVLRLNRGEQVGVRALEDLLTAVNVRTADHLNLDISRNQRREFDMVFPSR